MKQKTSPDRIAAAVIAGSLVGGLLVGVWLLANAALLTTGETLSGWFGMLPIVVLMSLLSAIPFAFGILVLGVPVWALLDHKGWTGPVAATVAGTLLATAGTGLLAAYWGLLGRELALFAPAGAAIGWTIQRIAYRPVKSVKPPPARPS